MAEKKHVEIFLQRREYLKKVMHERLLQGKEVAFCMQEISAINSVLNELLDLHSPQTVAVEVDALSTEEALEMIFPPEKYSIDVEQARRIRFLPTAELRIARTKSHKMDVVNIGLWKLNQKTDQWNSRGGFKIPVEVFSAFVQELIKLEAEFFPPAPTIEN